MHRCGVSVVSCLLRARSARAITITWAQVAPARAARACSVLPARAQKALITTLNHTTFLSVRTVHCCTAIGHNQKGPLKRDPPALRSTSSIIYVKYQLKLIQCPCSREEDWHGDTGANGR